MCKTASLIREELPTTRTQRADLVHMWRGVRDSAGSEKLKYEKELVSKLFRKI
jgi:hypothetical protein